MRYVTVIAFALSLSACSSDEPRSPDVPDPKCGDSTPLVTWETFGQGFLSTYCQGCHASTSLDRQGAPDGIVFDTRDATVALGNTILNAAAASQATMPPNGGPSADDREMLNIWLTCWAE